MASKLKAISRLFNPFTYVIHGAKAVVGVAGSLLGLGAGTTTTSPPSGGGDPVIVDPDPTPIIDLGNGIVIPSLQSLPDNTILIMAGIILLAVYGGWTLIRGRRA